MIIPTVRVTGMARAVEFYTCVLDFEHRGTWPELGDPSFSILVREGCEVHLSSHGGDGVTGQAIVVLAPDVDALFAAFCARGLDPSHKPQSPVHQGPTDQSWGTREFYADDPDGNTLRFMQR